MSRSKIVSDFNGFLDRATNPKQSEPDHDAIINLCQMIDEYKITPEDAVQAIHGKIIDDNPQTIMFALKVLEVTFVKCGSIVHNVICTTEYMNLLKDIIKTTEHEHVKQEILHLLETWADLFKYFPQYSELKRLLKSLKSDSNDTSDQDNNGNWRLEQFKKNNRLEANACSSENTSDVRNSNNSNFEIASNTTSEIKDEFKSAIREYQIKKKLDYKLFLKSQGTAISSDEEDNTNITSDEVSISNMNGYQEQGKNVKILKSYQLPKDLKDSQKQRHRLKTETQAVREMKHQTFLETCDNNSVELRQCQNSRCTHCERYKKKDESQETVIPKRWPLEIQKIKDSKKKLKNDFENYKQLKKQAYYSQKSDTGSKPNQTSANAEKKLLTKGETEEEEQLNQAIWLSQLENEPLVGQDTYLEDEDGLQLALDMSFAEAENNHISPMPRSEDEEDLQGLRNFL